MKKGSYIKIGVVVLCIIGVIVVTSLLTAPKIKLTNGDIVINLDEKYVEPGYSAYTLWFNITDGVSVTSNVDTSKVGNYTVIYKFKHTKKIRKVSVIETIPPELTLEGDMDSYVCPNTNYEEAGYKANDNYDGDITDKVIKELKENKIIYSVSDSSNNVTTVERNLIYEDNKAPEITLNGSNRITLKVGTSYTDPGYKANDNCLGDITDKVEVSGSVDVNSPGSYDITYKVSDGVNETIVTRNIYVTKGIATLGEENAGGVIYLTFDDGPSNTYTRIVLDTLKKYGVKATFFVVPKDSSLFYLIKEAYNDGHSIGIHSYSHTYSIVYASDSNFKNDVLKTNEIIKELTGSYTYLYRFPGGSSNTVSFNYSRGIVTRMASWLHENGYHYFDWNVSSGDAGGTTSVDGVANNVISRLSKNRYNVVLMHDTHDYSAYAVEKIILYGIENGYTFAPITMNTRESHHGIAN